MCECKSPSEHAEHLRREVAEFEAMFPEPWRRYVQVETPDGILQLEVMPWTTPDQAARREVSKQSAKLR